MNQEILKLNKKAEEYSKILEKIEKEISKIIVGQDEIIKKFLIGLVANGHILIEGVPGLAKTLLVKTLSNTIDADFVRLQFTPDLLPADIIGTKIYEHKTGNFKVMKGPIFSNFILADEINRAAAKVQSALLEAMQERQVSIQGETFKIKEPFMVLATQNPIESEGTYKLPEAQIDRFMFKLIINYPDVKQEQEIIKRYTTNLSLSADKVTNYSKITEIQKFNQDIYADEKIEKYVSQIVDATRNPHKYEIDVDNHIEYGASPRASLWLILAGKANAMLNGRGYVKPEDIQEIAYDVLRHRIILTYEAEAEEITPDEIIKKILEKVKVP
jgi:MoxR-like ATPase